MKSPCIAIDVSKGGSHVRSFLKQDTEYGKLFKIDHDKEGFEKLMDRYEELKDVSGHEVIFIFEATGVYHKSLQHFLELNKKNYYIISPLQSAKQRKLDLRAAKTDKLDPINIAKVYYNQELKKATHKDDIYDELKQLSRYYETQLDSFIKVKVNYRESLDGVFPLLDKSFDVYDPCIIALIQKYHHPENIIHHQESTIIRYLQKKVNHGNSYIKKLVSSFTAYCNGCIAGCSKDDIAVEILLKQLETVLYFQERIEHTLQRMEELAMTLNEYKLLCSIPGIGANLATRLLAEIGDINRFDNSKQLTAYAGIDPIIYQSGKNEGLHYQISKKGNKNLRKLLYLAIVCNLRSKTKSNTIKDYYKKKKQQANPMNSHAAYFACANKLLRIIIGMCKTKSLYNV